MRGRIKIPLFTIIYSALLFAVDLSFYTLFTLLAAAFHEIGHLLAAAICGVRAEQITVYPFGADIRLAPGLRSYRADFFISAAGAATNLTVGTICRVFFSQNIYLSFFALCNFLLAVINLLPASQLDGGGIIKAVLFPLVGIEKAEKILKIISFATIIFLWAASIYILFYTANNLSLMLICAYLFISDFISYS